MEKWNKVAAITLFFWLMKIVATTLGETLGDYISITLQLGYARGFAITFCLFLVVLLVQLYAKKYVPTYYWLVIIGTTTLGTEISDFLDRSLHLGYTLGSLFLVIGLGLTLFFWYKKYKSIAVFPIFETHKEIYFWIAVLFSNSLGTAFGDFISDVLGFTYLQGALITATIILGVILMHYWTKVNQIVLFWIAFVFTRPFGATFGDFLTKPIAKGGLDFGTLNATLIAVLVMIALIVFTTKKEKIKNTTN